METLDVHANGNNGVARNGGDREAYRHEALLYAGEDDFVDKTADFLLEGVESGEPSLVVVSARKIERLRERLNGAADTVLFADMADVGLNPARIIPAWREFVVSRYEPGTRLRGIGEPIFPERSAVELVECQRHEALLNLAFQDTPGFWLLCPYDTLAMPPEVIAEAKRNHPYVLNGSSCQSSDYSGIDAIAAPFAAPLDPAPADALELRFDLATLAAVRAFVRDRASAAGLSPERAHDVVLAVSELTANSVRHGGGEGSVRVWLDDDTLVCDVTDRGHIADPLAGRVQRPATEDGGQGLWLVTQLCDLVQIRPFPDGNVIRLHQRRR
jgi:anti-sigma regulatory factor (Ser/Thr protein kinase)